MATSAGRSYIVTMNLIPEVIKALRAAAEDLVDQVAQDIADDYTGTAAIDTGFMASSSYVVSKRKDTYGTMSDGSRPLLEEVEAPSDPQEAIVAVGATYAAYVEYGTSRMASQPAFTPAVDRGMVNLAEQFEELEAKLAAKLKALSAAGKLVSAAEAGL